MAKHDVDPVLRQLVRAVNESVQAAVPVTVTVHGTTLTGALVAESRYFSELVEGNPLMSALEPASGLLGKEYAREAEAESDHHLHVRAGSIRGDAEAAEGLWRVSLGAVDGWTLRASAEVDAEDRGAFARLLGAPVTTPSRPFVPGKQTARAESWPRRFAHCRFRAHTAPAAVPACHPGSVSPPMGASTSPE